MNKTSAVIAAFATALVLVGCAATPEQSTTLSFGETFEYVDGVTISVSEPFAYFPNGSEQHLKEPNAVAFVMTIENGSDENLQPVVFTHVSSAGVEARQHYVMSENVGADPQTTILPGGSVTWTEVYGVEDPDSLVLTTAPNMHEYIELVFTNTK